MKEITLTQGMVTQVDDQDFEYLNQWHWFVNRSSFNCAYAARENRVEGKSEGVVLMHRVINDTPEGLDTDHKDGNGLNNCRSNLRSCSHLENSRNRKHNRSASSRFKGVYWEDDGTRGKRWRVRITVNGKRKRCGSFRNEEDAALAYNRAAVQCFGEFARLNAISL